METRFPTVNVVMPGAASLFAVVLTFTIFLGVTASGTAAPLFPQITVDSREGAGQNLFGPQGYHFTAGVGWAGSAKALAITFDGITYTPLVNGTLDARSAFVNASVENDVVTGHFVSPNLGSPDLVLADITGVLLSGPYTKRTTSGDIGANQGVSVGSWIVTGGSLAPLFFAAAGQNASFDFDLFDVTPSFSPNSFGNNFSGQFAGIIAPVPEPSSLMLLGLGTIGVVAFARIKSRRAR